MLKIKKKIYRLISKLERDKRLKHQILFPSVNSENKFFFYNNFKNLDDLNLNRIFNFSLKLEKSKIIHNKKDMWSNFTKDNDRKNLIKYSSKKNILEFKRLINQGAKSNLFRGFLSYYNFLFKSKKNRKIERSQFLDNLISLSEYLKLSKVYNPDQGAWLVEEDKFNVELMIKKIFNKELNNFISPNNTYGFLLKNKFYSTNDLRAVYTAHKINNLLKNYKLNSLSEIGGGLGYLGHYSHKISKIDYTIFDLPEVLILQAYFLLLSNNSEKIHLWGENKKKNSISLMPYWKIFDLNKKKTLWINQDSFPEIDVKLSKKYLNVISSNKKNIFLSINQESENTNLIDGNQPKVFQLVKNFKNFELISRNRDFLTTGYIEEIYKFN